MEKSLFCHCEAAGKLLNLLGKSLNQPKQSLFKARGKRQKAKVDTKRNFPIFFYFLNYDNPFRIAITIKPTTLTHPPSLRTILSFIILPYSQFPIPNSPCKTKD
jgi:hypothetical protein